MKKDFAEKDFVPKKASRAADKKGWRVACIAMVMLFLCLAGFFSYNKPSSFSPIISSSFSQLKFWVSECKRRFQQKVVKVKQAVVNKNPIEPDIHFEFYTALPNMQITAPPSYGQDKNHPNKLNLSSDFITHPAEMNKPVKEINNKIENTALKNEPSSFLKPARPISNADQIEREWSAEFDKVKQSHYFIQLGVFKNKTAAERFRINLSHLRLVASIIPSVGREVFRVEVGPYKNKERASMVKQQLEKKGINGIIILRE